MDQLLSTVKSDVEHPMIGKQLFEIITSGMYDNPLMIYREYIQNAVDSIDVSCEIGQMSIDEGNITIYLNGEKREIIITDNGAGIPNESASQVLRSIGMSPKEGQQFRGFRGIGRLGGLAYCDELVFETRSHSSEDITKVSWDRKAFDTLSFDAKKLSLQSTIGRISNVTVCRAGKDDPPHFFRVRLNGVRRFHNDLLMNIKSVSDYVSQVAPVPYNKEEFNFADDILHYFSNLSDYRCYDIALNGKTMFRPYISDFLVSKNRADCIRNIEYFSFLDENEECLALGWYANTQFLASIPHNVSMRGIRIRQGNIEIGDEHFLAEIYTEARFAGWTIGEIHICNNKLKPNARRDGFEVSVNYERFLEQAQVLGRRLSDRCRTASNMRIQRERIEREFMEMDKLLNLPRTYIDEDHVISSRQRVEKKVSDLECIIDKYFSGDGYHPELAKVKKQCHDYFELGGTLDSILDGRKLRNLSQKDVVKHIATSVFENYNSCNSPHELVANIINEFVKTGHSSANG